MNEAFILIPAWLAGTILGTIFFGGLRWTIQKGIISPYPVRWFLGSLLLRMSVTLLGFYFVSGFHWERLMACLIGFIMARMVVMRQTFSSVENPTLNVQEANHASQP
ncbi:ATP synthase subunit I [Rubinisphaera italica]|uniref:N-ATPase, AtpR subunit n=1 Tax=Rubinisphaera italica TaxID=2527969 RepID=A0A5C5X9R0_9PLAN|nr:ATP synthase subunit I [Rubinisphaera italica]TWT59690.1 N-ATPase, AtpR subunit [Rubinisphaera italica]